MKFGQVTKYNKGKNHTENETGRQVPDFFLLFKKAFHKVKASGLQLSFNIFQ